MRTRLVTGATILLVLACFLAAAAAYAGGGKERASRARLAEAEALIDARRYNDAILLLAQIVKEDPERFEAAEALMNRIRLVRETFNQKLAELNTALFVEKDIGKGLGLIAELEELDPYPSQKVRDILAMARGGREVVYYTNQLEEIMNRARQELEAGRPLRAAAIYVENLGLAREMFDRAGYGNIVTGAVDKAAADLRREVAAFEQAGPGLEAQAAALQAARTAPELAAASVAVRNGLLELIGHQAAVDRAGQIVRAQNQQIRQVSATGSFDLHLRLLTLLVFGRGGEEPEGLSHALGAHWQAEWSGRRTGTLQRAQEAFDSALRRFQAGEYAQARQELDWAEALLRVGEQLQALWPVALEPGTRFPAGQEAAAAARAQAADFVATQVTLRAIGAYRGLMDGRDGLVSYQGSEGQSAQTLLNIQEKVGALVVRVDALATQWDGEVTRLGQLAAAGLGPSTAVAEQTRRDVEQLRTDLQSLGVLYAGVLLRVRGAELEQAFRGLRERFVQAVELQEGREVALEPILNELGEVVERPVRREQFPARALAIYEDIRRRLEPLSAEVATTLEKTLGNQEYLEREANLRVAVASLRSLAGRAGELSTELAARAERARQASLQAERYKQEGFLRVSQARTQINSDNLAAARDSLARAGEALDRSLEFQEDPDVRRVRDQELAALDGQIKKRDQDRVIAEVRQLIDQGSAQFKRQDYLGAQRSLLRAQRRWAEVFSTENLEVTYWLNLADRALSATAGREIALTDPLYNEMSQLLNLATADYLEGKRLLELQQRRQALESFQRAQRNIDRILGAFPTNRKASVLELEILALSAPDTLRTRLTEDFADAQRNRTTDPAFAYSKLQDIEEVSPTYPGLAALKLELEYALGLKRPPDTGIDKEKARALYNEASQLFAQRNRSLYPLALERLDEALRVDPDYTEAKALKDRINREVGGARTDVLPTREQQILTDAQRLFRQQQYLRARLLVDDLLNRAVSASHPDVVDLDRRLTGAGYPSQVKGR